MKHNRPYQYSAYENRLDRRERPVRRRRFLPKLLTVAVLLVVASAGYIAYAHGTNKQPAVNAKTASGNTIATAATTQKSTTTATATVNHCAGNASGQLILVSISARHLWACNNTTTAYDSPVVTGMENLPADLTPVGTYHIYAKQTNLSLTGSDSTGSWNDYVYYWMPFLDNQYGAYGFHDATWRPDSAFGNIDPNSSNASHGCVECPLATAKWLYNWAPVGTTVQVVA